MPDSRTASEIPQRRKNSIVRAFWAVARGWWNVPSNCSTTVQAMSRRPSSIATSSPTGPPPTINTGVSLGGSAWVLTLAMLSRACGRYLRFLSGGGVSFSGTATVTVNPIAGVSNVPVAGNVAGDAGDYVYRQRAQGPLRLLALR